MPELEWPQILITLLVGGPAVGALINSLVERRKDRLKAKLEALKPAVDRAQADSIAVETANKMVAALGDAFLPRFAEQEKKLKDLQTRVDHLESYTSLVRGLARDNGWPIPPLDEYIRGLAT